MRRSFAAAAVVMMMGCTGAADPPPPRPAAFTGHLPLAARRSPVCLPLPSVTGSVVQVTPNRSSELPAIVASAPSGTVILLEDGLYHVSRPLLFRKPNVTMRSLSGQTGVSDDPERVIIDGSSGTTGTHARVPELVGIVASGITIADLTLRNARDHLVHVQTAGADTLRTRIYNAELVDPGEQAVKINTTPGSGFFTDDGEVSCSLLELTDAARPHVVLQFSDGCYTGGIDAHQARGWRFANNVIRGFWCARGLAEHGIHVWTGSRDTVIEGNEITNSTRGIGLGLGQYDGGAWRNYTDGVCSGRQNLGHYGGRIRNNVIVANDPRLGASQAGFAAGIGLELTCDAEIANNTIYSTVGFRSSAIEWRFAATGGIVVMNNLTNGPIAARDRATGRTQNNVTDALGSWFRNVGAEPDLHLARLVPGVVRQGTAITDLLVDKDGRRRGSPPDIGAYEYETTPHDR